MGRITKTGGQKHEATLSPAIAEFVKATASIPLYQLPAHLRSFPRRWPFPRGDIYHWIPALNRFDDILDIFTKEYGLANGPQTQVFERRLLLGGNDGFKTRSDLPSDGVLDSMGFSAEGDRELVEEILSFTKLMLENCGNRSLYASSTYLDHLLNTTSLSLLETTLRLALRLAARYHASRQRLISQHLSLNLLVSHYNINLEKVNKLALPFTQDETHRSTDTDNPGTKAKAKLSSRTTSKSPETSMDNASGTVSGNDMVSIIKGEGAGAEWSHWARLPLYVLEESGAKVTDEHAKASEASTASPTRVRRPSTLGPNRHQKQGLGQSLHGESSQQGPPGPKMIELSGDEFAAASINKVLQSVLPDVPESSKYDVLHRLRVAKALISSIESRQQIVAIRMLAIANLAFLYPEPVFQQKILQQDTEEPRRLQLAYQLAELIHPPSEGETPAPRKLQTLALITLEALAKHKSRSQDVLTALNVQVSHGVLFYVVRKAVAELAVEDDKNEAEDDEWREALFYLLANLWNVHHRIGEAVVSAGLLTLLTEVLTLRTNKAERYHSAVLNLFDSFVINVRGAFQSLVDAKALNVISDLTAFEVETAYRQAQNGQGMPVEYRTHHTDYQMSYYKQQSLRWLLRFMNHMMTNNLSNFERLLRNFIDSPPLLGALRTILENAKIYGSNIWSQALEVLVNFIHNEPTSYMIVAEAGLTKAFLAAITQKSMPDENGADEDKGHSGAANSNASTSNPANGESVAKVARPNSPTPVAGPVAPGILPMPEAIRNIPSAFGAICLNEAGMKLFQASGALEAFFEVFESPEHVKVLLAGRDDAASLGGAFNELVRHHPPLKKAILDCVRNMLARVRLVCYDQAVRGAGAKLWYMSDDGQPRVAGGRRSLVGGEHAIFQQRALESPALTPAGEPSLDPSNGDVEMLDASTLISQIGLTDTVSIDEIPDEEDPQGVPTVSDYIRVVGRFLLGFTSNTSLAAAFVEAGIAEYVLDFATLPSLPRDFDMKDMIHNFHDVFLGLVEQKPHLVLPSIVRRANDALETLAPLLNHQGPNAFFHAFTVPSGIEPDIDGTSIVKALVQAQTLCTIIRRCFEATPAERSRQSLFSQVNLTNMYVRMVDSLGKLHEQCVWEDILLPRAMPDSLKASQNQGLGARSDGADNASDTSHSRPSSHAKAEDKPSEPAKLEARTVEAGRTNIAAFKNFVTLRYLFHQVPTSINYLFMLLGRSLLNKRHLDAYQKQNAFVVAEHIAEALLAQLRSKLLEYRKVSDAYRYTYWLAITTGVSRVLAGRAGERTSYNVSTLVLQAFHKLGGLAELGRICNIFFDEIELPLSQQEDDANALSKAGSSRGAALGGIKDILEFYSQIVDPRTVSDSVQAQAMASRSDRDKDKPDYFSPSQHLVETRMAVLPAVQRAWNSEVIDKVPVFVMKPLIEVLRLVFDAESEHAAFKRTDRVCIRGGKTPVQPWRLRNTAHLDQLKERGFEEDLAREALYRCYDSFSNAQEYCSVHKAHVRIPRNPIPSEELQPRQDHASNSIERSPERPALNQGTAAVSPQANGELSGLMQGVEATRSAAGTIAENLPLLSLPVQSGVVTQDVPGGVLPPDHATADALRLRAEDIRQALNHASSDEDGDTTLADLLRARTQQRPQELQGLGAESTSNALATDRDLIVGEAGKIGVVTVEDLEAVRIEIRAKLSERCLDVLSAHHSVAFELADLIVVATSKAADSASLSAEIAETLVDGLVSLLDEDDLRPQGRRIAAYAHLLALLLREKKFFDAALDHVKENLPTIILFIRTFPSQGAEESFPWIAPIVLIIEILLAEDEKPRQIEWTPPRNEESEADDVIANTAAVVVSEEDRAKAFEAIIEILPHIGKDESTAISAVRLFVALTRRRQLAMRLGEKRNLQRLFVMMKQLADIASEKLRGAFMLVLRHIVEDEETIRQIMRSEIQAMFEGSQRRQIDTSTYTKSMSHLVLRAPEIFVEVTDEKLMLARFDPNQRHETLALKKSEESDKSMADDVAQVEPKESANSQEVKMSTEQEDRQGAEKTKPDVKPPAVENPDGVIHYLLCELLSYKDVEDNEPLRTSKVEKEDDTTDVQMTNGDPASAVAATVRPQSPSAAKTTQKPEFKAEAHPIFLYRTFLLQCLTELLSSYNRTKVEFINFSRKADPQAVTPSKPRSGVLNYLLNTLIPVGTLKHSEDLAERKKAATSNWAISVIVALCAKTAEVIPKKSDDPYGPEEELDLLFVRKFVLEHALKAYKDAQSSSEASEVKYARILNLSDLFHRMLSGKPQPGHGADAFTTSQKQLAKLMFEKNFITILTHSIGEIDLSVPDAKRAVKYILRPLKLLTTTAVQLSQSPSFSSSESSTDDAEISSATSVSDDNDGREETPDLYRNSTLGIFEPNRDEDSGSETSDEDEDDIYAEEYDDEMDYEEEEVLDDGEVVSDEEENADAEGMGPIEGLAGDVVMNLEVDVNPDLESISSGDEDEDLSDELDADAEDADDGEEEDEILEEITGDDAGASDPGARDQDEEDWQDEDEDEEQEEYDDNEYFEDEVDHDHGGGLASIHVDEGGVHVHTHLGPEGDEPALGQFVEDYDEEDDGDDDDDEDADEDMHEEDLIYELGAMEDDEEALSEPAWGMDNDGFPAQPRSHRHGHHHHHRVISQWELLAGGPNERMILPPHRGYRTGATRTNDDGMHPLLRRPGAGPTGSMPRGVAGVRHDATSEFLHAMGHNLSAMFPGRGHFHAPLSYLNNLLNHSTVGPDGTYHITIGAPPGFGTAATDVAALNNILGLSRPHEHYSRQTRGDPGNAVDWHPMLTAARWLQEAQLLFGPHYQEKATNVVSSILRLLVPPALELERTRKQKAAEEAEKRRVEEERKAEEERRQTEQAEREAKEKKEREEREAAEKAAAEEEAAGQQQQEAETGTSEAMEGAAGGDAMEGVETTETQPAQASAHPGPSESAPRVRTTIRGRELDITNLGIDLEYLDALPEELREDVIMAQFQEQRSQAAAAGEEPTDISREFLEALPADIREELLQQEAQDRRRREREEARRRAAANSGVQQQRAEDIDPASFLATLDPGFRRQVLMEQDEDMLAQLPADIANEARALGGIRRGNPFMDMPRLNRPRLTGGPDQAGDSGHKRVQRQPCIQMLDKAGVASLMRLMFTSQQGSARQTLNGILKNVCENKQTRAEVISLLLSTLQDGSLDASAVERSYAQMSLRAKQANPQKTPQSLKRSLSGKADGVGDMTPQIVTQQSLGTLLYLTSTNASRFTSFFLTEHEVAQGSKFRNSRKGKGKESKVSKYPINTLLGLLERPLVIQNASIMDQLAALLATVTSPLNQLLKENKEKRGGKLHETTAPADAPASELPTRGAVPATTATPQAGPADAAEELTQAEPGPTPDTAKKAVDDVEEKEKKIHKLSPPEVPEENLRLIVNILTAQECSSKTFRETVSTIQNLSAIPGAREAFGQELVKQAQALAANINQDLVELTAYIRSAKTGTEVQGKALSRFSPAGSDQQKLLRVLTALGYLYRKESQDEREEVAQDSKQIHERQTLLASLYQSSNFELLWAKLSECLSAIRLRGNMFDVATILLPLIEAFMVVCKNTLLQDAPLRKDIGKDIAKPSPGSQIQNLFFAFTEEHRKILNDLVRHNPKLMSGNFSLLVKNSKVLEFDNKRNYFSRKLHSNRPLVRHPHQSLQLSVRRDQVFLDSYKSLYYKSADEWKYGKLNIRFHGEEGVDAGGVTREWFQVLARQMFNPDYALFTPVASDRTTFHPNRLSSINQEHLTFFKFIGRIIGKALYEGRVLDCHFSRAVYKRILGKPVSIKDMETVDLDYYKSLLWMLENDITEVITETFSVETEAFGQVQIIDLIENGRNIPVTEDNKHEYVRLVVEYRLTGSVQEQLEYFLKGFHDIIPADLVSIFNEQELELLISGLPDIDIDDWKANTEYHNYSTTSPQIQWFWRAVRSFDKEERAKLLQFVTGTSKVPLNGFKELEGMNGFSKFNIHRDYGSKDRLPSSHTCFNQLDLPEYDSYELLRQQVYTAITAGSEYFGFA